MLYCRAKSLAHKHAGAVAFSRTGDPATGELGDATVIVSVGENFRYGTPSSGRRLAVLAGACSCRKTCRRVSCCMACGSSILSACPPEHSTR